MAQLLHCLWLTEASTYSMLNKTHLHPEMAVLQLDAKIQ